MVGLGIAIISGVGIYGPSFYFLILVNLGSF